MIPTYCLLVCVLFPTGYACMFRWFQTWKAESDTSTDVNESC